MKSAPVSLTPFVSIDWAPKESHPIGIPLYRYLQTLFPAIRDPQKLHEKYIAWLNDPNIDPTEALQCAEEDEDFLSVQVILKIRKALQN